MDDEIEEDFTLTKEESVRLSDLWNENAIQNIYKKRNQYYGVSDSTKHFYDKIDNIVNDEYIPDNNDVLLVRHHTKGIHFFAHVFFCFALAYTIK